MQCVIVFYIKILFIPCGQKAAVVSLVCSSFSQSPKYRKLSGHDAFGLFFMHSTHFHVDHNPNVEGGSFKTSMQNKAIFSFHYDIHILKQTSQGEKNAIFPVPGCFEMPCLWFYVFFKVLVLEKWTTET